MLINKVKHQLGRMRDRLLPSRFDGWLRIYLTLECNLRCPYCVHNHNLAESKAGAYRLVPWQEWAEFINRTGRNVIFTGGEPFLYPDLVKLLNAINPGIKIKIYTNFGQDMRDFIAGIHRSVTFFGTYHPSGGPAQDFISTIDGLTAAGKFKGTIHMVGWEQQLDFVKKVKRQFADNGWFVYIDSDQYLTGAGSSLKFRKNVRCRKRIYLIAPDGRRFICVSKMLRQKDDLGNVLHDGLGPEKVCTLCPEYGYCNPCDSLGDTEIIEF
jgi:MoaA/NifB/PqqE/SkfB family radical SAM enzyme